MEEYEGWHCVEVPMGRRWASFTLMGRNKWSVWCRRNIAWKNEGVWDFTWEGDRIHEGTWLFYFKNEGHAAAFKLMWL